MSKDQALTEAEFWAILTAPIPTKPIFFRLYYNEDGTPICYSMEDMPHNYIEIDAEMFHRGPLNVRVVDGKIKELKPASIVKKLTPSDTGTPCSPNDICIVVNETQPHTKWSMTTYDTN